MGLKSAFLHFALAAMLLRALLPAGWMPQAAATGSPFVICTLNGPVHPAPGHQADHDRAKAPCVFASAAPLSPPADAAAPLLPMPVAAAFRPTAPRDADARGPSHRPNAPRAPPVLV